MKISLDKKILSGFIICAIILITVAVISFKNSEKFIDTNSWVIHTYEVLYEFEQILTSSVDAETNTRGFIITGEESYTEPFQNAKSRIQNHINRALQLTKDNSIQQENIKNIKRLAALRIAYLEKTIDLRKTQDFESARKVVLTGEGKRLQDGIRKLISNTKETELELLAKRKQDSEVDARNFNRIFIFLLTVIGAVLIIVYIIIIANLKALRKAEQEASSKNWTLAGSGELARAMQGNKSLTILSDAIINHLATYLNVQIGAVYITNENNKYLSLTGSYALNKKIRDSPVVSFGEGLVGQAALEKRHLLFQHISENHFNINTSFGEVIPKNIVAIPVVFENLVIAVIELGSISEFTILQIEYLNMIVDSIAIAIISSQSRDKTSALLEETQQQAEELAAQQEELRQSNEELHAKTELLEESQVMLHTQKEELKQTNEELGQKANMLEDQKDKLQNSKTEIEAKAQEIEVTSKYKSEFLANMSHELRTPLNSILILAQLISENKSKTLNAKEIEFAKNIHNSGNDLLNLINEILDLSKVEAGKLQLDVEEIPLENILTNISSMFSTMAKNKGIEFNIVANNSNLPLNIITDQQRVEQILRNLLSNALKFTEKGGTITLTINSLYDDVYLKNKIQTSNKNMIAFSVSDTGIGIPQEKLAIIFEAFQQADGSTKRKYGGTGLGLSISRELALVLGGEIQVESKEGEGSTFTVLIPTNFDSSKIIPVSKQIEIKEKVKPILKEDKKVSSISADVTKKSTPEEDAIDDRNHISENDRVILIIEDEMQFANILLGFVRERRYKGIISHQGTTGISYARHYKPDAIMLDVNLPVMDGMEVLKLIKNDPELRHIPVQIISAHNKKIEGMKLGAFDYIVKPVSIGDLQKAFNKIESFLRKKFKKLLIVEDNPQQNIAIKELIGNGDVKSFSAYRGLEAYEMLTADTFDCIIVDLGLPDMSGFELLEKIKANEKLNKIPIVVYTGKDLNKDDNARLNKLADTVVLKTANSHERLLDETILFLHRVESKLPKEKQVLIRSLHKTDGILKDKKILLVDDDIRNIYSLTNALEEEGLHCLTAENGIIALEMLKKNPTIDLILMDIMMPEMDGYEATAEIRKLTEFNKIPIIALTAKAMKGDKEKCIAIGMSDYISKPVDIAQLLSLMRVWLYR